MNVWDEMEFGKQDHAHLVESTNCGLSPMFNEAGDVEDDAALLRRIDVITIDHDSPVFDWRTRLGNARCCGKL